MYLINQYIFLFMSNPIISEFSLTPPHQVTQHLALSRLRNTNRPSFSQSTVNQTHQDIIVNVKRTPELSTPNRPQQENIRQDVDACLDAIQMVYSKKNQANGQQNVINQLSPLNQSTIRDDAIHRIDSNIVMKYVNTVYKDYPIRNRFADYNPPKINTPPKQQINLFEARPRAISVNRASSKQKQFLNITQQSKMGKRDVSRSSNKKEVPNTVNKEHRQTFSTFDSPVHKLIPYNPRVPQTAVKSQLFQKVAQDFRYCVNCEKSILSINIQFHEKYECSNFQTLYKLSFKELASFVEVKIHRIKEELREKLAILKQRENDEESRPKKIANRTLGLIEEYLREEQRGNGEQRRVKYGLFKESQNNEYSQCIELTHRLHWFQSIKTKLDEETLTTNTSFNRGDENKPIDVIHNLPVMSRRERVDVLPAPYLQPHPHLHRWTKQSF